MSGRNYKLMPANIVTKDGARFTLESGYLFGDGNEYLIVYGNGKGIQESSNAFILKNGKVTEGPAWIHEIRKKVMNILIDYHKKENISITYITPAEKWEECCIELTEKEYALRNQKNEQKKILYKELEEAEEALTAWCHIHWNTKKDGSAFAVVSRNLPKGVWISKEFCGASLSVSIPGAAGGYYEHASYRVYSSDGFTLDTFDGVLKAVEKAKEREFATIARCKRKLESIDKEVDTAAALFAPLEKYFNESGMNCDTEVKRVLKGIFKNFRYDF